MYRILTHTTYSIIDDKYNTITEEQISNKTEAERTLALLNKQEIKFREEALKNASPSLA